MENIRNIRVLTISMNAWNDNVMNTLPTLFQDCDPDNIYAIYCRTEIPNTKRCNNFLSISEINVVRKFFHRKIESCQRVGSGGYVADNKIVDIESKVRLLYKKVDNGLFSLIRDLLWTKRTWKEDVLEKFVDSSKADKIFVNVSSSIHTNKIALWATKRLNVPVILMFGDDNLTYKASPKNLFALLHRYLIRKFVFKLIEHSSKVFVISPKMKVEYDKLLGIKTEILTKPITIKDVKPLSQNTEKNEIRMLYCGNLLYGRDEVLLKLIEALNRYEYSRNVHLDIYTHTNLSSKKRRRFNTRHSAIHPVVSREVLIDLIDSSDVLVFPESSKPRHRRTTRLSFSTKLTDYLGSGKLIFAIGSENVASMDYLIKNNAAIFANDNVNSIYKVCVEIVSGNRYDEYINSAQRCVINNHELKSILNRFNNALLEDCKRVIIVPSNTDLNRGDQALIWQSIECVKEIYGTYTDIYLMGSEVDGETDPQVKQTKNLGFPLLKPILKHPSRFYSNKEVNYTLTTYLLWGVRAILDWIITRFLLFKNTLLNEIGLLFLSVEEKRTFMAYRFSHVVYMKGGGFLHSYGKMTDGYLFYYFLYDIRLAQRWNKRVVVLPNSIGPLKNGSANRQVNKYLARCDYVFTRDVLSQEFCESNTRLETYLFPDLGFFLECSARDFSDYLKERGVSFSEKNLLITVRPYRFPNSENPRRQYQEYINAYKEFIEYALQKGFHITLFAHTLGPSVNEDDRVAIKDVLAILSDVKDVSVIADEELNCRDVEKIYSYYDYVIGTRFHSVVFALNGCIPTISIAYGGNKGVGIMNYLHLDDYVLPIENLSGEALKLLFERLVKCREEYVNILQQSKLYVEQQKTKMMLLLKHVYNA